MFLVQELVRQHGDVLELEGNVYLPCRSQCASLKDRWLWRDMGIVSRAGALA